jgi:hypothetical protein
LTHHPATEASRMRCTRRVSLVPVPSTTC